MPRVIVTEQKRFDVKGVEDEVRMMFSMFDQNGDGTVSTSELKAVLQELDAKTWTEKTVDKILSAYDTSGDGELQFTEFWAWINGHGNGKELGDLAGGELKEALATQARDMERCISDGIDKQLEKQERAQSRQQDREQIANERACGGRVTGEQFVRELTGAGVSKQKAEKMWDESKMDGTGDVDFVNKRRSCMNHMASVDDIKGSIQEGIGVIGDDGQVAIQEIHGSSLKQMIKVFQEWDKDGSGSISLDELGQVLSILNPTMGMKTLETLLNAVDLYCDGGIDFMEFAVWLSGKDRKKKQQKKMLGGKKGAAPFNAEEAAKLALALHNTRAAQAWQLNLQKDFEQAQHTRLQRWIEKSGIKASCNTLYAGPKAPQICRVCYDRHVWVCHGCGFVNYEEDCINGCSSLESGWTCVTSKCSKGKCGCKKNASHWRIHGSTCTAEDLGMSVKMLIQGASSAV